ncbi:MAG: Gfo/Idh/MocA family oxidoreductase [Bryobacterales bacterium]|nr:Gfo/Idh/MocA family oxidoreductase [Bryobacterales bacterium]
MHSRRQFLSSSTGAAAALGVAPAFVPAAARGQGRIAPSDRITVGIVGSGLRAVFETLQYPFFDNTVIVAVADCQESRRLSAKAQLEKQYAAVAPQSPNQGIRMYADFRELLAQPDIDAVYIASPDHWHVSMLLPALKAGKHVHCEKPLGVSVQQDLAALHAVRNHPGLVFQYGAELRAFPEAQKAIELVLNGRIGEVKAVYAVSPPSVVGGSAIPVTEPPQGFDYDAWLGPAPYKPFCADRCLSDEPRGIFHTSDYTLGNIANWGAHPLDQVQRWADATGRHQPPLLYEGSGRFPLTGLYDAAYRWNVRCTWADGMVLNFVDNSTYHELPDVPHPDVVWNFSAPGPGRSKMPNGSVFVGTEGWVIVNYGRVVTHPASLMDSVIGPTEKRILSSALETVPAGISKGFQPTLTAGQHQNWIRAIRTGSPVVGDIAGAFRSDMVSQLADLCIRTGQPVGWDPSQETIIGNDAARKAMKRPMREPWGVS